MQRIFGERERSSVFETYIHAPANATYFLTGGWLHDVLGLELGVVISASPSPQLFQRRDALSCEDDPSLSRCVLTGGWLHDVFGRELGVVISVSPSPQLFQRRDALSCEHDPSLYFRSRASVLSEAREGAVAAVWSQASADGVAPSSSVGCTFGVGQSESMDIASKN